MFLKNKENIFTLCYNDYLRNHSDLIFIKSLIKTQNNQRIIKPV